MILFNRKIGDYRVLKIKSNIIPTPGQCFKVAGLFMTAAAWDNEGITFLCQDTTLIQNLKSDRLDFSGPIGSGFTGLPSRKSLVVAGGTGIAAVMGIISGQKEEQETHLAFYSKQAGMLDAVTRSLDLSNALCRLKTRVEWNTIQTGRPAAPLDPLLPGITDIREYHVFVAGPSSLMEATKKQCRQLGVADTQFHINF